MKKGLSVSWSDDEESEDESAKVVTALTGRYISDGDSCNEDVYYEDLADSFEKVSNKSEEVYRTVKEQERSISLLQAEKKRSFSLPFLRYKIR